MYFSKLDPPDGLGKTLPKIRARPDDQFSGTVHSIGDLSVFQNAHQQTDVPPLRVTLGAASDYRYVIYYPEQDRIERKDRPKVLRLKDGPSLRRMEVQHLRHQVLKRLDEWAKRHPDF